MSDLKPRDFYKAETRKRNTKNFWLRSEIKARNELTHGPRDLRKPAPRGVTFYSPKHEPKPTGSTRPMGRSDYASGTVINEKGQVTSQVPRVSKGVQRAGALDLFPKLKRTVEQAARPLKIANPIWRAASALDNLAMFLPSPDQTANNGYNRYPVEGGYWEKRYGDFGPYTDYNPANGLWMHTNTWHTTLSGQALSGTVQATNFTAPADGTYGLYYTRYVPVRRYAHHSSYFSQTSAFNPAITSHKWADATAVNADFNVGPTNVNTVKNRVGKRVKNPIERQQEWEGLTDTLTDQNPLAIYKAIAVTVPLVDPLSVPDTKDRTKPKPKPILQPLEPAGKRPPAEREHQGKAQGSKKFGQMMASALDKVSEAAEVVDAVYDALPEDVKKRWEKGRESRGLADQAGQYGIDGADWKAKAIWENRHKIDYAQAVENIVKNEIEDRLYGAAYGAKDDVLGRGRNRGNPQRQFDKNRKYNHKRSSEKRAAKWSNRNG